ncbi:MAG: hypothetical protein GTN70_07925 [Deltaproteobacteria bacterium]|nr:hypothetical protein [Deltaproteobacteria bacterium]
MIRIALICPAEKKILGWVNMEPGQAIDVAKLGRDFEPVDGPTVRYALLDEAANGEALLCPSCRNGLMAGPDTDDLDAAIELAVPVLLGSTKIRKP